MKFADPDELLIPALKGTENLLASVAKFAPKVKRVVIISSFAAMVNAGEGDWPGHIYNESGASVAYRNGRN